MQLRTDAQTVLHRADPRVKLLMVLALSIVVFMLPFSGATLLFAVLVVVSMVVGVERRVLRRSISGIALLLTIALVAQAMLTPGRIVFEIGPVSVTAEGIYLGGLVYVRLLALAVLSVLFAYSTSSVAMARSFETVLAPLRVLRVNVGEVALVLSLSLRFLPLLAAKAETIRRAQAARGLDVMTGGIRRRVRAIVGIVAPLMLSTFRDADLLATAMDARGYHPGRSRIILRRHEWGLIDAVLSLGTVLLCVVAYSIGMVLGW